MREHARRVRARLAAVAHRVRRQRSDHDVEIRIRQHDRGGLAAELEAAALDLLPAQRTDPAPGARAPREADLVDQRVPDKPLAHLAVGGHDVQHAGRQAGFLEHLRQQEAEQRRLLGRLENDGATGQQRGASFGNDSASGKFQGTIAPTTPTGWRRTSNGPRMPARSSSQGKLDACAACQSR